MMHCCDARGSGLSPAWQRFCACFPRGQGIASPMPHAIGRRRPASRAFCRFGTWDWRRAQPRKPWRVGSCHARSLRRHAGWAATCCPSLSMRIPAWMSPPTCRPLTRQCLQRELQKEAHLTSFRRSVNLLRAHTPLVDKGPTARSGLWPRPSTSWHKVELPRPEKHPGRPLGHVSAFPLFGFKRILYSGIFFSEGFFPMFGVKRILYSGICFRGFQGPS